MPSNKAATIISDVLSNAMEGHTLDTFTNYLSAATRLPESQIKTLWEIYWNLSPELKAENETSDWKELIDVAFIAIGINEDKIRIVTWLAGALIINGVIQESMVGEHAYLYHKFRCLNLAALNPEKYIDRISPLAIAQLGKIIGYDIKYGFSATAIEEVKA